MKKRRNVLVCLIGIDGAGKTTLARRLCEEIGREGTKTRYVMGRFESYKTLAPLRWLAKKIFLRGERTDQSVEGVRTKQRLFRNRWLAVFWRIALYFDYTLQLGFKVCLPLRLGTNVYADRYVYDTAVDLAADRALPVARMPQWLSKVFHVAPRPDLVFLVDLSEDIAYERNLAKHDNLPLDYFKERRTLYLTFKGRPEVKILDGSRRPDDLLAEILRLIERDTRR
jgi:thymidylate kinase